MYLEILIVSSIVLVLSAASYLYTIDSTESKYANAVLSILQGTIDNISYILFVFVPIAAILVAGILAYLEAFGVSTPIPESITDYYVQTFILSPLAVILAILIVFILDSDDSVLLHELHTDDGGVAIHKIPPQKWTEVDVYEIMEKDGDLVAKERSTSDLAEVEIQVQKGYINTEIAVTQGYECERYDKDDNIVYVSYLAGKTDRQMRIFENSVDYVKRVLAWESDRAHQLEANELQIVRSSVKNEVNNLIHILEGEVLEQNSLTQSIEEAINESSYELLEDTETEDIVEEIGMEDPTQSSVLDEYQQKAQSKAQGDTNE